MAIFGMNDSETTEILFSLAIVAGSVLLALLTRLFLGKTLQLCTHRTKTTLDDLIIRALTSPVFLGIILTGIWLAMMRLSCFADHTDILNNTFMVLLIVLITLALTRLVNVVLTWYGNEVSHRTVSDIDDRLLPVLKRVSTIILAGIGLMLILDQLNVNITPLVAGLGISGLAVAIALQSTLSNFLAGTYVVSDAVIRKGHYILLDSGQEGIVEDIGWRSTKIRQWQGNLIVLPNSKLSEAVVTDYEAIEVSKTFSVICGVAYDSDLERVETVTLEVASHIQKSCPVAAADFQSSVRFKEFGDSNIQFAVVLKARDRLGQFQLKHEFIKALHRRFKTENIIIDYPVRRVLTAKEK